MKSTNLFWKVWAKPVFVSIVSFTGLLAALIGDGLFDALSWFMLGLPVCILLYYLALKKP